MWTDSTLQVVNDNDQYVDASGTTYPASFPKLDIPGLFPVTLTQKPDESLNFVTGFHIGENLVQVWDFTPLDATQLAYKRTADIDATWEAIKVERERRKDGGFPLTVEGVLFWFHSDAGSKLQHFGNKDTARDQVAAGGAMGDALLDPHTGVHIVWKTLTAPDAPEVWIPMTCQLAFDVVNAAKSAELSHHRIAVYHQQRMEASANPSEYDFSEGWPKIFGE